MYSATQVELPVVEDDDSRDLRDSQDDPGEETAMLRVTVTSGTERRVSSVRFERLSEVRPGDLPPLARSPSTLESGLNAADRHPRHPQRSTPNVALSRFSGRLTAPTSRRAPVASLKDGILPPYDASAAPWSRSPLLSLYAAPSAWHGGELKSRGGLWGGIARLAGWHASAGEGPWIAVVEEF